MNVKKILLRMREVLPRVARVAMNVMAVSIFVICVAILVVAIGSSVPAYILIPALIVPGVILVVVFWYVLSDSRPLWW